MEQQADGIWLPSRSSSSAAATGWPAGGVSRVAAPTVLTVLVAQRRSLGVGAARPSQPRRVPGRRFDTTPPDRARGRVGTYQRPSKSLESLRKESPPC